MRLYHRTHAAEAIVRAGFRDGAGTYMTDTWWEGVWLSDRPLDENEGACGNTLLALDIPEEEVVEFEWVENIGYRTFLVPAAIVNRHGPPVVEDED